MNGHTEIPAITFSENCDYGMLNALLNTKGVKFGWAVRIWFKQAVIITALWGASTYVEDMGEEYTSLLAWSEEDNEFVTRLMVPTDDITRLEIL